MLLERRRFLRSLRRHSVSLALVTGALGIALALVASLLAIVRVIFLTDLPVRDPAALFALGSAQVAGHRSWESVSPLQGAVLREQAGVAGVAMFTPGTLYGQDSPASVLERLTGTEVDAAFFRTLGVTPVAGRMLDDRDIAVAGPRPVVIAHDLWVRRFGADPAVLEKRIDLGGMAVRIVGVAPKPFTVPGGTNVWTLLEENPRFASFKYRWLILRAANDKVAQFQSQAASDLLAPVLGPPTEGPRWALTAVTDIDRPADAASVVALAVAAGLTLILGWLQLTNLHIGRVLESRKDISIALALGSTRRRVFLTAAGEGAAVGTAAVAVAVLTLAPVQAGLHALLPRGMTSGIQPSLGPVDLAAMAGAVIMASVAAGMLAAAVVIRSSLRAQLHNPALADLTGHRLSTAGSFALAVIAGVILYGTAVIAMSYSRLVNEDLGLSTTNRHVIQVIPRSSNTKEATAAMLGLEKRLIDVPGIRRAALSDSSPLGTGGIIRQVVGPDGVKARVRWRIVGTGYFDVLKARLLHGRTFSPEDGKTPVAIINRALLTQLGLSDLSRAVTISDGLKRLQVIGVVDLNAAGPGRAAGPEAYEPAGQSIFRTNRIVLDLEDDADAVATMPLALQAASEISEAGREPVAVALTAEIDQQLAPIRSRALLLFAFGCIALGLSVIGTFARMSRSVIARKRDIAIRLSLGASPSQIQRQVLAGSCGVVVVAGLISIVAGTALARLAAAFFFGVAPFSPVAALGVLVLLSAAALVGAWGPAAVAARTDPGLVLKLD